MPTGGVYGFVRPETPHPHILYARRGSFESIMAATLPIASDIILASVSGLGPIEILAGGVMNNASVDNAAISLVARSGGTLLGEARVYTDAGGVFVPGNSPWLASLTLWFTQTRNAVSSLGKGEGGLSATGVQLTPVYIATHTQRVGLGNVLVGLTSSMTGVAAVGITLDWLRIVDYPDGMP